MSLAAVIEAQAMRETEDSLREFVKVCQNIGLNKVSIAMLLRTVADELDPPSILMPMPEAVQ